MRKPTAVKNATWYHRTRCSGVTAPSHSLIETATPESIDRPRAPHICCEVLMSPEASPAFSAGTPEVAAAIAGMIVNPIQSGINISAGRTSTIYFPSTGARASHKKATIITIGHSITKGLKP